MMTILLLMMTMHTCYSYILEIVGLAFHRSTLKDNCVILTDFASLVEPTNVKQSEANEAPVASIPIIRGSANI
jgi:hypothetical protein